MIGTKALYLQWNELKGLEVGNLIADRTELHLHAHEREKVDPATRKMTAEAIRDVWREQGWERDVIEVEKVQ